MGKILSLLLVCSLALLTLSACTNQSGQNSGKDKTPSSPANPKIVCTTFPQYDWVRQILGSHLDEVELSLLLDSGVDLHSYQGTVDDIIEISDCDMLVYVGGESDKWIEDAQKEPTNKNMRVVNLMDSLGSSVKSEEFVEGMEQNSNHTSNNHNQVQEKEQDEHIWLSLKNAQILCKTLTDNLCELDPNNAADYKKNAEAYVLKLQELDQRYQETITSSKHNTLLFGDRFPFRYLVDDYNISYYAAFVGCSAETEASFETVAFLAQKVDELGLNCVLSVEGEQHKLAETVIQNTSDKNQKLLAVDSMQSTTAEDLQKGVTYLSIMEKNLSTLQEALQ